MTDATALTDIGFQTLDGETTTLGAYAGHAVLVVNVASECGLTPQYTALQQLWEEYRDRGFFVLGFPCNQFGGQEPGDAAEIRRFTDEKYGVTFPLAAKIDVNGEGRHPLYAELTRVPDASGEAGDVQWNFEKFLVDPSGAVAARFRPTVEPDAEELLAALEEILPV